MVLGQRHDGHSTHRVAHEYDRSVRHDLANDLVQVMPELADGAAARPAVLRSSVAPLIPRHDPGAAGQRRPLEAPARAVQTVAVAEHHRYRGIRGAVEGSVQQHPVVCHDGIVHRGEGPGRGLLLPHDTSLGKPRTRDRLIVRQDAHRQLVQVALRRN